MEGANFSIRFSQDLAVTRLRAVVDYLNLEQTLVTRKLFGRIQLAWRRDSREATMAELFSQKALLAGKLQEATEASSLHDRTTTLSRISGNIKERGSNLRKAFETMRKSFESDFCKNLLSQRQASLRETESLKLEKNRLSEESERLNSLLSSFKENEGEAGAALAREEKRRMEANEAIERGNRERHLHVKLSSMAMIISGEKKLSLRFSLQRCVRVWHLSMVVALQEQAAEVSLMAEKERKSAILRESAIRILSRHSEKWLKLKAVQWFADVQVVRKAEAVAASQSSTQAEKASADVSFGMRMARRVQMKVMTKEVLGTAVDVWRRKQHQEVNKKRSIEVRRTMRDHIVRGDRHAAVRLITLWFRKQASLFHYTCLHVWKSAYLVFRTFRVKEKNTLLESDSATLKSLHSDQRMYTAMRKAMWWSLDRAREEMRDTLRMLAYNLGQEKEAAFRLKLEAHHQDLSVELQKGADRDQEIAIYMLVRNRSSQAWAMAKTLIHCWNSGWLRARESSEKRAHEKEHQKTREEMKSILGSKLEDQAEISSLMANIKAKKGEIRSLKQRLCLQQELTESADKAFLKKAFTCEACGGEFVDSASKATKANARFLMRTSLQLWRQRWSGILFQWNINYREAKDMAKKLKVQSMLAQVSDEMRCRDQNISIKIMSRILDTYRIKAISHMVSRWLGKTRLQNISSKQASLLEGILEAQNRIEERIESRIEVVAVTASVASSDVDRQTDATEAVVSPLGNDENDELVCPFVNLVQAWVLSLVVFVQPLKCNLT